jgi:thioredoxin reductase (NADPH)
MFTPEELRQAKIFACLDKAERARLPRTVADVRRKAGEWLLREGETPWF